MDRFSWISIGLSIFFGALVIIMRNNVAILVVLVIAFISLIALLVFVYNKSIKGIKSSLSQVVGGQLNINIKKSKIKNINSVGQKINEYLTKIRKLVCQYQNFSEKTIKESSAMKTLSENLRVTSSEIASTVQSISEAVNNEAESTYKVKQDMQVFSQGVDEIYENAKLSFSVATHSKEIVEESFETFKQTFSKVEEIKEYNDKVLEDMVQLDQSIRQISTITEAVEAIASQTHLLALNASIEAARAGEAGKGFAVVANEVSKLADDSSSSAQKIKELVNHIIKEIDELTTNIKVQTDVIGDNVNFAKKALEKSNDIYKAVDEDIEAANSIVKLTEKQKTKIEDITNAIEIINEATQQNAAVTEEITASTQEQLSIIESMYNSMVYLNNAIEYSNNIIENFVQGFKITDEIKNKVKIAKELVEKITRSQEITNLTGKGLQEYLKDMQNSVDFIELISFINKQGYQEVTTEDVPEEHRDVSAREYFQKAISGETFISKEYISTFTNHYNITIAVPIYKNNEIVGVVLADINLNEN